MYANNRYKKVAILNIVSEIPVLFFVVARFQSIKIIFRLLCEFSKIFCNTTYNYNFDFSFSFRLIFGPISFYSFSVSTQQAGRPKKSEICTIPTPDFELDPKHFGHGHDVGKLKLNFVGVRIPKIE